MANNTNSGGTMCPQCREQVWADLQWFFRGGVKHDIQTLPRYLPADAKCAFCNAIVRADLDDVLVATSVDEWLNQVECCVQWRPPIQPFGDSDGSWTIVFYAVYPSSTDAAGYVNITQEILYEADLSYSVNTLIARAAEDEFVERFEAPWADEALPSSPELGFVASTASKSLDRVYKDHNTAC